jgi:hypothetical protein
MMMVMMMTMKIKEQVGSYVISPIKKKKKENKKKKMSKGIIYSVSIEKIKMRIIIKEKLGDIQKVLCV